MATYTPKAIVGPVALTASAGTSVFTGTGGHTYIIRTIHVSTSASGKTFRFSIGADAAGTRLFDDVAITQSVPSFWNEWLPFPGAGAHDLDASCSATTMQLTVGGYDYA